MNSNQQPAEPAPVRNTILHGDVRTKLRTIAADSVDCVVTSPPYFRLRNYGTDDQIGLEDHIERWVHQIRNVFTDVARALKPTGSVWLNLGDSYSRDDRSGAPAKSLLLAPERLLLALAADGWIIRNKVIWAKTNPMPNSVRDRLACTYEHVYFLTRKRDYFFDLDAIRIRHRSTGTASAKTDASYPPLDVASPDWAGPLAGNNAGLTAMKQHGRRGHPLGKNPGDVWRLATANFRGAHFATFPKQLIERPVLATCPERTCTRCGQPWQRERPKRDQRKRVAKHVGAVAVRGELRPACTCGAPHRPGLVLDPFFGAGTVALVAGDHRRDWLGIEINRSFIDLAEQRITAARTERKRKQTKPKKQRPTTPADHPPTKRAA